MNKFIKRLLQWKSEVGRKFIIYILLFSSVITFIGTGLQLYLDFDNDLESISTIFKQIELSYLESITNNLWVTDNEVLQIQLEGILRLPDMQFIEIHNEAESLISVGISQKEQILAQTYPLIYNYNGLDVHLGELYVTASLKGVYSRFFDRILLIFSIQMIKTFLVSLFIYYIFYNLVGKHLTFMASFVNSLRFESIDSQLHLNRKSKIENPDELGQLAASFNQMRENLKQDISKRKHAEEELQKYKYIVSSSSDMLAFLNKQYIYLAVNPAYAEGFKLTPESLTGKSISSVFGEEFFNTDIKPHAERCFDGEEVNFQNWFEFPGSGHCYMDITYYPYYSDTNKIMGFVVNGRNITVRKKAEDKIKNQLNELHQWQTAMFNREERVLELKSEVNNLLVKEGKPVRYTSTMQYRVI